MILRIKRLSIIQCLTDFYKASANLIEPFPNPTVAEAFSLDIPAYFFKKIHGNTSFILCFSICSLIYRVLNKRFFILLKLYYIVGDSDK